MVALLALGFLSAPLSADAQTSPRGVRIGWLYEGPRPSDIAYSYRRFHQALLALGYVEGQIT